MSSVPPNNLDQVIAWIRVFIQENSNSLQLLQNEVKALKEQVKRSEDVDL